MSGPTNRDSPNLLRLETDNTIGNNLVQYWGLKAYNREIRTRCTHANTKLHCLQISAKYALLSQPSAGGE
jgi:hypothetical protein